LACNKDVEMIVQYVGVIVQYTKALADHSDTVNICICDDIFMLFFFVEHLFATCELSQYKKGGPEKPPPCSFSRQASSLSLLRQIREPF
jgi:hypothetical protein